MEIHEFTTKVNGKEYRKARTYIWINDRRVAVTATWKKGVAKKAMAPVLAKKIVEIQTRSKDEKKGISNLDMTVAELANDYMETGVLEELKRSTLEERRGKLDLYIVPSLGTIGLRDSTLTRRCESFIKNLSLEKNYPTVKATLKVLNGMFNYAVDSKKGISANPVSKATIKSINKKGKKYQSSKAEIELSIQGVNNIMEAVAGKPEEITFQLMAYHGLRVSEALAVRWENIDLDKEVIKVTHQIDRYTHELTSLKTENADREVPIEDVTKDLIARLISETSPSDREGFLYKTCNGTPVSYSNFLDRKYNPVLEALDLDLTPQSYVTSSLLYVRMVAFLSLS